MKVNPEMASGLRAFTSLFRTIQLLLEANKIPIHVRSAALNWYGFYIGNNGKKDFFIGIYLDDPEHLTIESNDAPLFDKYASGEDEVVIGKVNLDNCRWFNTLDLTGNNIYLSDIEFFINKNVSYLKSISKNVSF